MDNTNILAAVIGNPNVTNSILEGILNSVDESSKSGSGGDGSGGEGDSSEDSEENSNFKGIILLIARHEKAVRDTPPKDRAAEDAPIGLLSSLSEDPDKDVRFAVTENPYVPKSILEVLVKDDEEDVAHSAWNELKKLIEPQIKEPSKSSS